MKNKIVRKIKKLGNKIFGAKLYTMHFTIVWQIIGTENKDDLENQLKECLKDYGWAKPLATVDFYIVPITNSTQWSTVFSAISAVASANPGRINVLMSPITDNMGGYNGWLPKETWDEINKRTSNGK